MNSEQRERKRQAEKEVRYLFSKKYQAKIEENETQLQVAKKAKHKFDIYEGGKFIGGITTSPWKNSTGSNNTGGQDRASTELLWLSLWQGRERRVMILTDREMANKLFNRWESCPFPHKIEIIYCNLSEKRLEKSGVLGQKL